MAKNENEGLKSRIDRIRRLAVSTAGTTVIFEAAGLAQTVLHDTVGGSHPLMVALDIALKTPDWQRALAASKNVLALYDEGALTSPRLAIAHEIEGSLLDIAQAQAQEAERTAEPSKKQLQLAIAAFLAGASLEDALRRLCESHSIAYDAQRTSISKLQAAMFQPSKHIDLISSSENKQITAWGDTRNKADHGRFDEITNAEVLAMVIGVRGFLDKHLP